jgi:ABC-2 type transport system ATP-binding protein
MSEQTQNALVLSHLTKTYPTGLTAVKDLCLTVKQGEFLALIGPNGAGKSTTIGMISTLVNITSGTIEIFGHNIVTQPLQAKSLLGVVPQEINLNPFETCLNTLIYQAGFYGIPKNEAIKRAKPLLESAQLWHKRNAITKTLSGGMKRRLMIARALIHSPQLLLLDEPTAGVDIEIRANMWAMLTKLNNDGLTIILTTHYLEEAQTLCDRLAIIHHGKVHMDRAMRDIRADLNKECFIFALEQTLKQVPTIDNIVCELNNPRELKVITDSTLSLTALLNKLANAGVTVSHIISTQNYVEEMLLNVMNEQATQEVK